MKFGMEAIKNSGFPHEFASVAMAKSFELEVSLALRAGQAPNVDKGFEISPKPMLVKTKTSSTSQGVPLVGGFIPRDQETFGRSGSKPIPEYDNNISYKQLPVTLQEILKDAEKGIYELSLEGNDLIFRAKNADSQEKRDIKFSIDLSQSGTDQVTSKNEANLLNPWKDTNPPAKPTFWDDNKFGNFHDKLEKLFLVYMEKPQQNKEPLEVTAFKGNIVSGDADKLWVAIPEAYAGGLNSQIYNMSNMEDQANLIATYISLKYEVTNVPTQMDALDELFLELGNDFTQTAGAISPYEFLMAKVINEGMHENAPSINNLIQHGPETNNPGEPSSLNDNILHFYKGLAVLTESERELVDFVMQDDYLNKHFINVHKGWKMDLWAPVVAKQLELKQPVSPETLASYQNYMQENNKASFQKSTPSLSTGSIFRLFRDLKISEVKYKPVANLPKNNKESKDQDANKLFARTKSNDDNDSNKKPPTPTMKK